MTHIINGLHHVTAIASDPQRNLDFYAGALGLRLVKKTVNFDDPSTYHFYFGNQTGEPGTLLTFFPWPGARRGVAGPGQTSLTSFSVPADALGFWQQRLRSLGVDVENGARRRYGEESLRLRDPDGLAIALVADAEASAAPGWAAGQIPEDKAIRSLFGVTLAESNVDPTARFLAETLGFRHLDDAGGGIRYTSGEGRGRSLELQAAPERPGRIAAGSVHHIAFRAADDAAQLAWRRRLIDAGVSVTPVIDRNYFHSIYFREPGGVLFEIATDPPGFTIDESEASLGSGLQLPAQYESQRSTIESLLPPLSSPAGGARTSLRS